MGFETLEPDLLMLTAYAYDDDMPQCGIDDIEGTLGHLSSAYSPCRSSASPLQEGNKLFHMPGLAPAMYWCYPLQS